MTSAPHRGRDDPARLVRDELLYKPWRDERAANAGSGTASLEDARSNVLELPVERVVSAITGAYPSNVREA